MTITYQYLEGAKMGSLCGGHIGQIQDGRHPENDILYNFRSKSVLNINDSTFVGLSGMGNPFMMLFCSFNVHVMC